MACIYLLVCITAYAFFLREFETAVVSLPAGFAFGIVPQWTEARTGASCLAFQWQIISAICATFGRSTLHRDTCVVACWQCSGVVFVQACGVEQQKVFCASQRAIKRIEFEESAR
jgi:hypothetical protein